MTSDLPRVRVDDDGRVAVQDTFLSWVIVTRSARVAGAHVPNAEVRDPGWRDAVIVPLPEPNEIHERAGARWGAGTRWGAVYDGAGDVWATSTAISCAGQLCGAEGARRLAAGLLAAAAHVDQAEAVSTDGQ